MSDISEAFVKMRAARQAKDAEADKTGEPAKGEPAKGEPAKVEPAKAGEPAKGEPAKGEPAKGEPAKTGEPAKGEPAKEPTRLERRLRTLLDEKKQTAARLAELQALVAKYEERNKDPQPPAAGKVKGDLTPSAESQGDPRFKAVEEQVYELKVAEEGRTLQAELDAIKRDFPHVPQMLLARAVERDDTVDLRQLAEEYDLWAREQHASWAEMEKKKAGEAEAEAVKKAAEEAAKVGKPNTPVRPPAGKPAAAGGQADPYEGVSSVADMFARRRALRGG